MADKLMMGNAAYRKAFDEAAGDKAKYMAATAEFGERHRATAAILWNQFTREITPRTCICANGGELVRFLKMLPLAHEDFKVVSTSSEDIDSGLVKVVSDPVAKTITIIGSMFD
ncbi:hypothetical protein D3C75_749460 [compost metagenome]